jgi:hypothetical protein
MRRATDQALRTRDSSVVLATRGVTCRVSMWRSGRPGSSSAGLQAVEPGRGQRPSVSACGQRPFVEQAGMRQAHQHLVGLGSGQVALTEEADGSAVK